MSHTELHEAIRALLVGTKHMTFRVGINSIEHHPGRVHTEYTVEIGGIPRMYRSADPRRLLSWVREAIKAREIHEEPRCTPLLRRVK